MKISPLYATLLFRDLSRFKTNVLHTSDYEANFKLLNRIRAEVPCTVIGSVNFLNSIKILRTLLQNGQFLPVSKLGKVTEKFLTVLKPMIKAVEPDTLFYFTSKQKEDLEALDLRITLEMQNKKDATDEEVFSQFEDFKQSIEEEEDLDTILNSLNEGLNYTLTEKRKYEKQLEQEFRPLDENGLDIDAILKQHGLTHKDIAPKIDPNNPFAKLEALKSNLKQEEVEESKVEVVKDLNKMTPQQKLDLLKKTEKLVREKVTEEDFIEKGVSLFDKYKKEDYDYTLQKGQHYKIMKMPIYAQTFPYITANALAQVGAKGQQVLAGWLLEDQVCVAVSNKYDLDTEVTNACVELQKQTGYSWYNATYDAEWVTKGIRGLTWVWLVPIKWQLYFGNLTALECQHAFKFFNRNGDFVSLKQARLKLEDEIDEALQDLYEKADKYEERMNKWLHKLENMPELEPLQEALDKVQYDYSKCMSVKGRLELKEKIKEASKQVRLWNKHQAKYDERYKSNRLKLHRTNKRIKKRMTEMKAEALKKFRKLAGVKTEKEAKV